MASTSRMLPQAQEQFTPDNPRCFQGLPCRGPEAQVSLGSPVTQPDLFCPVLYYIDQMCQRALWVTLDSQ